jgi:hypothetical protein
MHRRAGIPDGTRLYLDHGRLYLPGGSALLVGPETKGKVFVPELMEV